MKKAILAAFSYILMVSESLLKMGIPQEQFHACGKTSLTGKCPIMRFDVHWYWMRGTNEAHPLFFDKATIIHSPQLHRIQ